VSNRRQAQVGTRFEGSTEPALRRVCCASHVFEISIAFGSEAGIAVQVPPDEKIPKLARPAGPFALRHALQPAGRGTGPLITPWFSW
jgi:hypothetical protein